MITLAVVTSLIPLHAPALPFVSYAGGDLVIMLACVGLLLSIANHSDAEAPPDFGTGPEARVALPGGTGGGRGIRRGNCPKRQDLSGAEPARGGRSR
jgi:hypothetical protein